MFHFPPPLWLTASLSPNSSPVIAFILLLRLQPSWLLTRFLLLPMLVQHPRAQLSNLTTPHPVQNTTLISIAFIPTTNFTSQRLHRQSIQKQFLVLIGRTATQALWVKTPAMLLARKRPRLSNSFATNRQLCLRRFSGVRWRIRSTSKSTSRSKVSYRYGINLIWSIYKSW